MEALHRLIAPEAAAVVDARARAGGLEPPSPGDCALLAWAAVTVGARSVVEVGSSGGVSTVWLASVLAPRGMVTSLEPDPTAYALTAESLELAGLADRVRAIAGEPEDVLPRLADGGYDVVLLQGSTARLAALVAHARRLLRPRGILVVRTRGDHAATLAIAEALVADEAFAAVASTGPDGRMLVATRRDAAGPDAETDAAP